MFRSLKIIFILSSVTNLMNFIREVKADWSNCWPSNSLVDGCQSDTCPKSPPFPFQIFSNLTTTITKEIGTASENIVFEIIPTS